MPSFFYSYMKVNNKQQGISLAPVKAFMKVERDRFSILKKGSRTGYLCEPQRTVCSRMCETPVLSIGVVRNPTLKTIKIEWSQQNGRPDKQRTSFLQQRNHNTFKGSPSENTLWCASLGVRIRGSQVGKLQTSPKKSL